MKTHRPHIWQLDFTRGLAVIGMIIFHLFFILYYFDLKEVALFEEPWLTAANLIRFTFITLVGISIGLSSHKPFSAIIKHALKIAACALIVTIVTYIFLPEAFVRFGILHLIASGILIAAPTRHKQNLSLILAAITYILSFFLPPQTGENYFLLALGFPTQNIFDVDYFPLFPWLSLIYFGIYLSKPLRLLHPHPAPHFKLLNLITTMGRNSLLIYMIHVPILLLLIALFSQNATFYQHFL